MSCARAARGRREAARPPRHRLATVIASSYAAPTDASGRTRFCPTCKAHQVVTRSRPRRSRHWLYVCLRVLVQLGSCSRMGPCRGCGDAFPRLLSASGAPHDDAARQPLSSPCWHVGKQDVGTRAGPMFAGTSWCQRPGFGSSPWTSCSNPSVPLGSWPASPPSPSHSHSELLCRSYGGLKRGCDAAPIQRRGARK
jgi:hypothetical protein